MVSQYSLSGAARQVIRGAPSSCENIAQPQEGFIDPVIKEAMVEVCKRKQIQIQILHYLVFTHTLTDKQSPIEGRAAPDRSHRTEHAMLHSIFCSVVAAGASADCGSSHTSHFFGPYSNV